MFDHSFPAPTPVFPMHLQSAFANTAADTSLAFDLTTPDHNPGAAMSGTARPIVLDRFATLAEAMRGAIALADQMACDASPQMLVILDRDDRLVLAGAASVTMPRRMPLSTVSPTAYKPCSGGTSTNSRLRQPTEAATFTNTA